MTKKILPHVALLLMAGIAIANATETKNAAPKIPELPFSLTEGTKIFAEIVEDAETGEKVVLETVFPYQTVICEQIKLEDGTFDYVYFNPDGNPQTRQDLAPRNLSGGFPSLKDFGSSIVTKYDGDLPENFSKAWDQKWTIMSSTYPDENDWWDYATYSSGFSGNAEYFTHAFTSETTLTFSCPQGVDAVEISVSSDDNATVSVGGISCTSTLNNPAYVSGELTSRTTSVPVTISYENIGGPYNLSFTITLKKRHNS